jgi:hypothetical protein
MAPRQEKSSTPPQQPTKTEPAPQSTHSSPAHLRQGVKLAKDGPGQTWFNLTRKDVEEYMSSHPEPQDQGTRKSLLARLSSFISRAMRKT